jgi:hypothetical protein
MTAETSRGSGRFHRGTRVNSLRFYGSFAAAAGVAGPLPLR